MTRDERDLIAGALAGDRVAARSIYDAHVGAVHSLASRMTSPDRAAEVTQDVFVRAFARLHQFRGQSALRTWLHRITVSVALNARRLDHSNRFVNFDETNSAISDPERDPILVRRLHEEIDGLPEPLRTVFILRVVEGYDHAEIAHMLNVRERTSRAHLCRARSILRAALEGLNGAA
jgi:RNA polymerase sigma-70 factor, ECF subfamily